MKTSLAFLLALVFLILPPCSIAFADSGGKRIALAIGNAKYPDADSPLKEPVGDMHAMADELKRSGFEVATGENLDREAMQKAFDALYGRIRPGSDVLIFFSGYGIQSGRQTFLIPIGSPLWTEADVRRDGFSLDSLLGEINSRGASVKIAILDASRRNPYERRFRSYAAGLAPATAPQGSLVMYSAAPGTVVADATSDHSLFVNELLKEIRVPGLTAEEALNRTRVGVSRASSGDQVPWFSSSLTEEFSFGTGPAIASTSEQPKANTIEIPPPPKQTKIELPPPPPPPPPKQANLDVPPPSTPKVSVPELPTKSEIEAPPPPTPRPPPPTPTIQQSPQDAKLVEANNDPAIRDLTNLINDNPNDEAAFYKRGQLYASKGVFGPSINDFDQAIKLNPRDVEALNNRCWVRTIVGELQSALKDCDDALALRPNFVDALDSRGLVNLKLGNNTAALNDFDAALRLNPKLASSLYGRGLARQRAGLADAGERDIQAAKQISPEIAGDFTSYGVR